MTAFSGVRKAMSCLNHSLMAALTSGRAGSDRDGHRGIQISAIRSWLINYEDSRGAWKEDEASLIIRYESECFAISYPRILLSHPAR